MPTEQISSFLDKAIRNRISVRLIAEQHITLSQALSHHEASLDTPQPGIVDIACCPAKLVTTCAKFVAELCEATYGAVPEVILEGFEEATFS